MDFRSQAREYYKKGEYSKYAEFAKKQYNQTKDQEDLEEYERSKKILRLSEEIQEFLKMEGEDSYKILGLDESATLDDIKKSFREKAHKYHPTKARINGAEDAFRIIQEAYFKINTESKKKEYDERKNRRSVFNNNPFTSSQIYNANNFSFTSDIFTFRTEMNAPYFSFAFTDNDFSSIYSELYRRGFMRPRNISRQESTSSNLSILLILFFVFLSVLL